LANGDGKHPDRITALASGFVALMALAVSTYNVVLQRQQIRAQTWPHLSWTYTDGEVLTFQLTNSGVGPAIVKDFAVMVDGKSVKTWDEAFTRLGIKHDSFGKSSIQGKVLGPGSEQKSLFISDPDMQKAWLGAYASGRVTFDLCYCSVLDDCWQLSKGPVKRCTPHTPEFEQ
jgi:hypothetical protein